MESQNVGSAYKRILQAANTKIGAKINKALLAYCQTNKLRDELALLSLIMNLR